MKLQAPSSKLQGKSKLQTRGPFSHSRRAQVHTSPNPWLLDSWELELFWSLELGAWKFRRHSWAANLAGRDSWLPSLALRRQTCAFTLLELMVVVVLIGIATAVIVPQMKGTYEDARLRSASRELVGVFNIASSRSVSLNEIHRVRLDRKTGRYFVERKVREGESGAGFIPIRDVPGGEGTIDTRISIAMRQPGEELSTEADSILAPSSDDGARARDADQIIAFYPDGTADSREILLQDREGFRRLLRLNPITASVQIVEVERK